MLDLYELPTGTTRTAQRGRTTDTECAALAIHPAERVGRFEVLRCIGMGGMGQVYAAYDPKLDRTVALKVLHGDRDGRDNPRLVREAQALARLSHPNVVAVHDVGVHRGRLFVAMEFVEGVTLREWLRAGRGGRAHPLVEVLDYALQAGEGLAAAHRAGLVHRDFKPGNVLIGRDGRVRVVDFGLVRVADPGTRSVGRSAAESERDGGALDDELLELLDDRPLTRPGAVVGTPAYMAPEQLLGLEVGAAADQFAFCLTVWEAIFGTRAFVAKTVPALLEAIRRRKFVRARAVECPRGLEAVLCKGLAFSAGRRHPSMEALLGGLRAARTQMNGERVGRAGRRRSWLGALAIAGAVASTAFAMGQVEAGQCAAAEDALVGIWDEATKDALERVFERRAEGSELDWGRFERRVDEYVRRWSNSHREACEATVVERVQSVEVMYLRMACLDARRQELAEVVENLVTLEVDAEEAVGALGPVSRCDEVELLRSPGGYRPRPEDPASGPGKGP